MRSLDLPRSHSVLRSPEDLVPESDRNLERQQRLMRLFADSMDTGMDVYRESGKDSVISNRITIIVAIKIVYIMCMYVIVTKGLGKVLTTVQGSRWLEIFDKTQYLMKTWIFSTSLTYSHEETITKETSASDCLSVIYNFLGVCLFYRINSNCEL